MAGSFSDYWENVILDHVFKTSAHTAATNIYIALCTTAPTDATTGSGLSAVEVATSFGYSRQLCNTWDAAAGGATENTQSETFAQATSDWGSVTHFALVDAAGESAGNMLAWGSLAVLKNIQSGDTAKFAAGDIDVVLT
jgi:hypothetical protein